MTDKNSPKFAFYYLLSLVALIFMGISVGLIFFGIINQTISDPLLYPSSQNFSSQFKFAISALIISVPLYYLTLSLIRKGLKKGELNINSGIRRWLTYFILFVSALVILGFLIGIINNFLSGEITLRFILKALTVFIISGLIFAFYFYDIKQSDFKSSNQINRIFLISSLFIVLAAFISVWFFIESPQKARDRRLDQRILSDISNLESSINYYYSQNATLPDNLPSVIEDEEQLNYFQDRGIEYKKTSEDSFELCADFKTNSDQLESGIPYIRPGVDRNYEAGYDCIKGYLWDKPSRAQEVELN